MPPKINLTKEDCLKWFQNPNKNPLTNRIIKTTGKFSIFHEIKNQCEKYKNLSKDKNNYQSDLSSESSSSNSSSSKSSSSKSSSSKSKHKPKSKPKSSESNSSKSSSSKSKPKSSSSNSSSSESSSSESSSSESSSSIKSSKLRNNILNNYNYYPDTNNENFRDKLNNLEEFNFNKYKKISNINNIDDFNELSKTSCPTNKFEKAYFQYFVSKYISNKTPYNSLLLYYSVGTGKTCASILIAESILIGNKFYDEPKIYVILPKPLKNNFIKTIYDVNKNINNCTGELYKLLSYKIPLNKIINQRYKIMTYYEFIKFAKNKNIENKTIIVDEAHNLRNPDEIDDDYDDSLNELQKDKKDLYNSFFNIIKNGKNNKLILMTGTPMYNQPDEIIDIFNLLLLNDNKNIIKDKKINYDKIGEISQKYVSYINNNNPFIYGLRLKPKDSLIEDWINSNEGIIKVKLSKLQYEYFNNKDDKTNYKGFADFGPSNIVYNIKKENNNIFSLFNKENNKYKYIDKTKPTLYPDSDNLGYYSPKILKICEYIKTADGIVIIYSRLVPYGILPLALALEHMGYNRYTGDDNKNNNLLEFNNINKNNLNYTILTSENNYINNIGSFEKKINLINSKENINGSKIKVILITKKASEGLSFLNIREIHILDPWYHYNRFEQIIGRGIRRCSHINLPLNKRNITLYIYCGYFTENINSVDLHALKIANNKLLEMNKIENIIKKNAIDCLLNKNLNFYSKNIFKNLGKIEIINSQNNKILVDYGNKDDYNCLIKNDDNNINYDNIYEDNITIIEKYVNNIKDIIKNLNYISYNDLKLQLNIENDRYLDLAINKSIYPNKIISKYYLYWGNNGLYKVNKNNNNNNVKEIILENIKINNKNTNNNDDEKNKLIINYLQTIETINDDFNLLYKIYLYFNNENFNIIMKELLNNIDKYKNIINILKKHKLIINKDNKLYYIDIFKNFIIKDNENNEIDLKIKFKDISINNNNNYGSLYLNNEKNPKNIIFKIHNNKLNNNGAVCETKNKKDIETIINQISENNLKSKLNKESLCQYLANLYYINNNLKIIPYKKMID